MPASGIVYTLFMDQESTFATPPADWDVGTDAFYAVEPNFEGLEQKYIANNNYRQRVYAPHDMVRALRSGGTVSFKCYAHGRGGSAVAENAQATTFYLADLMRNALGGRDLGYAAGIDSGTAAAPVLDAGQGANFNPGDWIFATDTTTGEGEFICIESVSTDTLTLRSPLSFTPDAGGADVAHAVVASYIDSAAMVNRSDANHITHSFLLAGEASDDLHEVSGCKLNVTVEGITPGESPMLGFECMYATGTNESLTYPDTSVAILGDAPLVTATGNDTTILIAQVGSNLAATEAHSVAITIGAKSQPVPGIGGTEGILGYTATGYDDTALELSVPYDDSWATAAEAGTQYHCLIQVGTTAGTAIGFYFPRLEFAKDVTRAPATDLATSKLMFRALERTNSTTATGDQLELYRSKVQVLFSCP